MATLVFEVDFPNLSEEDVSAVYDQTDKLRAAVTKKLQTLPIGEYAEYPVRKRVEEW